MFKPRKVGWSDYGRKGMREGGGNCVKYLKGGGTEKKGGDTKMKGGKEGGGKLGQGVGALIFNYLFIYSLID